MQLCPLAKVQNKIQLGAPLPFSIRTGANQLLLARGQVVADEAQMESLLERGAFVNLDELRGSRAEIYQAPPELLPGLWRKLGEQVSKLCAGIATLDAAAAFDEAARYLAALSDRAPDLAIFCTVRPDPSASTRYGILRSLQTATAAHLMARRLGWDEDQGLTLVKAALTANLAMLDLQERLANQTRPLSAPQRQLVDAHPMLAVQALQAAGVTDGAWLRAVAEHHALPDGAGYPASVTAPSELATALRTADVFTAKLSGRAGRAPLAPPKAARDLLLADRTSVCAMALIKEFGLYPPGSLVQLQNGDTAVVVQRPPAGGQARIAVLMNRAGQAQVPPRACETDGRDRMVTGPAGAAGLSVRIVPEQLFARMTC